jgi:hypothetical protein
MRLHHLQELTGSFVKDTEVKFQLELTSPNDEAKLAKIAAGFISCTYKMQSPILADFHVKGCADGGVLHVLRQFNVGTSDASCSRKPKNQQ